MIQLHYFRSFDDSIEDLQPKDRKRVCRAIDQLIAYFSGGSKTLGLGLRKLKGSYWEIRVSIALRVLFIFEKEDIYIITVGNHDDIRRYLSK